MSNTSSGTMPQNVKKYVYKGTSMVNVVLMLCQIFYMFIFWEYKVNILLYYTYFSTVNFIFACVMLKKGKIKAYIFSIFGGIFGMMILSVICLGWEFGFQHYCIGLAASLIFTDYYLYREKNKGEPPMANAPFLTA